MNSRTSDTRHVFHHLTEERKKDPVVKLLNHADFHQFVIRRTKIILDALLYHLENKCFSSGRWESPLLLYVDI